MTAKEYLQQARFLDQRIDSKIAQVASLNDLATKCSATLTGIPRNPNRGGSTMADAVCKIVDLQAEINRDIDRLVDLKREIMDVIKAVPNTEYQTILEKRYLCFTAWGKSPWICATAFSTPTVCTMPHSKKWSVSLITRVKTIE